MPIEIKLNIAEQARRARQADPSLSEEQLALKFRTSVSRIKAAFVYKQPGGRKPGRQRA